MKYLLLYLKVCLLIFSFSGSVKAQNWNKILKVAAADREGSAISGRSNADAFGNSVAIYGDYALVGSFREKEDSEGKNNMDNAGAAYLFKLVNGTWVKIKKMTADDRSPLNYFGTAVALHGDYAVITAGETYGRTVYIFKKDEGGADNWGQIKKIPSPFYEGNRTGFGISVSIEGDYIVVGAPYDDTDASESNYLSDAGAAFIFKKNQGGPDNWGQIKKVTATTRHAGDQFGYSVGISGDMIIIGAPYDDYDGHDTNAQENAGSAFMLRKDQGGSDQWGVVKKIVSSSRSYYGVFGTSVGISGDRAIVGASGEDFDITDNSYQQVGAAYIIKRHQGGIDNWGIKKMITAPVRSNYDRFGFSVAIDGDQVVVGADQEDEDQYESNTLPDAGSVYVFRENKDGDEHWGLTKKIVASTRGNYDRFGCAVSISGENTLIGAMEEDEDDLEQNSLDNSGSAYIYNKNLLGTENWAIRTKLTASTGSVGRAYFGAAVSIHGNFAIVGAKSEQKDSDGLNPILSAGAAYILFNDGGTWIQVKKICAPQRRSGDNFGISVSIHGGYAIVGAMYNSYDALENNVLNAAGAAYIFQKDHGGTNNWGLVTKITAGNRKANAFFGASVSMGTNYAVVGAWGDDKDSGEQNTLPGAGSAYIFKRDLGGRGKWGQLKKITAPVRSGNANFGYSVALAGERLLIGAPWETMVPNASTQSTGAAYMFEMDFGGIDNWGNVQKLTATVRNLSAGFGNAVALHGTYAIVGAPFDSFDAFDSDMLTNSGAAYIFKKDAVVSGVWGQMRKVVSSFRRTGEQFGNSVSINGNFAVVGATHGDETHLDNNSGAAFLLKKDQEGIDKWGVVQMLLRGGSKDSDFYGEGVAISGQYAIIGAPGEDEDRRDANTITDAGAAYIFQNYDGALPVTLTSFEAKKEENISILTWTTTEEINSDYFEIQRSSDGHKWLVLDKRVPAEGSGYSYSFVDFAPLEGKNLYRLKMVDLDGTSAFSQIKTVVFDREGEILIYPNPVAERLFVSQSASLPEIQIIKLFNNLGQVVMTFQHDFQNGLDITKLKPGVFTVQLRRVNGDITVRKILVGK